MSFCLPEPRLKICAVSVARCQVQLVEWRVNGDCDCLSVSLPDGLLRGVEIFTDGFLNRVPETNSFCQIETETVVGQREGDT